MGAVATCASCKQQYKVDSQSLKVEADVAEAAPPPTQEELKLQAAPVEELKVQRAPKPAPPPSEAEPAAEAPKESPKEAPPTPVAPDAAAALAQAAAEVTKPAPAPEPAARPTRAAKGAKPTRSAKAPDAQQSAVARERLVRRKKRKLNAPLLMVIFAMVCMIFVIVLMVFKRGGGVTDVTPEQGTNKPPVAVTPTTPDKPAPPPGPKLDPNLPVVELSVPPLFNASWSKMSTPVDPIKPSVGSDVVLWSTDLLNYGAPDRAIISGLFVADSPKVYQRGVLHVQLLNSDGMVYAEKQVFVPVVCAKQGLAMRLPVPKDLMAGKPSVVAEFTPLEPVADAAPLEMVQGGVERVGDPASGALKLSVHNPSDATLKNPTVVVEVMTQDGWPLGLWQGKLAETIGPNQTLTFQAVTSVDDATRIGRVVVRGYGLKS